MDESLSSILFIMRCMSVPTLESFKWRLAETIAWWEYKKSFRSSEFDELIPRWYALPTTITGTLAEPIPERIKTVNNLSEIRAKLLRDVGKYPSKPSNELCNGRLITYDFDRNWCDGAAMAASDSFYDWENAPPWDLWLFYVIEEVAVRPPESAAEEMKSYILAWVPAEWLRFADNGVAVNPERSIFWVEDLDSSFIQILREAGFVQNSNSL
jgi:hypothetical protein